MPRIPVRVEPYQSPSRQHRHFKNKRDQVLRALGKAAYINGSHFAIMWVSARGDVETYASEAFQGRLEDWFVSGGIADEAKSLVSGSRNRPRKNPFADGEAGGEEALTDDEAEDVAADDSASTNAMTSTNNTPLLGGGGGDVFFDGTDSSFLAMQRGGGPGPSSLRRPMAPLDTNMANELYARARDGDPDVLHSAKSDQLPFPLSGLGMPPLSAPLPNERPGSSSGRPRGAAMARSSSSSQQRLHDIKLENEAARTAFLELRFGQLQQGMCKTVAKAWIKIIEPKKQTRCPYNKGEEGKPTWWPEGVRHREPDHLMKPERHSLLLTILRSPKIQVARLQLATAEVVALIRADRVSLLMDVYRVAREEEKMREAGVDMDLPMTVGVSTLEGWSEETQKATSDADKDGSGAEEDDVVPGIPPKGPRPSVANNADNNAASKKRGSKASAPGITLTRSASTSAVTNLGNVNKKRKSLGTPDLGSASGSGPQANWALVDKSMRLKQQQLLQQQQQRLQAQQQQQQQQAQQYQQAHHHQQHPGGLMIAGVPMSGFQVPPPHGHPTVFSGSGYEQVHGLITPLSAHSQLVESDLMAGGSGGGGGGGGAAPPADFGPGYMSAPQPPHPQLYPHHAPHPHPHAGFPEGFDGTNAHVRHPHPHHQQQQQQLQSTSSDGSANLFNFKPPGPEAQRGPTSDETAGALGLYGVPQTWDIFGWGVGATEQAQQQQQQQQQQNQDRPQPTAQRGAWQQSSSQPRQSVTVPQAHAGDSSQEADSSFASTTFDTTIESNGPDTPSPKAVVPLRHAQQQQQQQQKPIVGNGLDAGAAHASSAFDAWVNQHAA